MRGTRYVFVSVRGDRFFGYSDVEVLGATVRIATAERALIDAVDRPRYAGGIGEVSRIVARGSSRVRWDVVLDDARRLGDSALAQRLGYLLDLNNVEVSRDTWAALGSLVRPGSKIHLGSRAKWGLHGRLARRWNVIENVPHDVLRARDDRPKRRVTFTKQGDL